MLKREIPTGPAVDLLRRNLHALLPGSVERREVEEFLAGTPRHSPLPWVSVPSPSSGRYQILYNHPKAKGLVADQVAPDDAELALVAVNNFYELVSVARSTYDTAEDCGLSDDFTARLHRLLVAVGELPASAASPSPIPPAVPCPPPPLAPAGDSRPMVGTVTRRDGTVYYADYDLFLTYEEAHMVRSGVARPFIG